MFLSLLVVGSRYLGLEMNDDFLTMSKARREEIENRNKYNEYIERLAKTKIILPPDNSFVSEEINTNYGVPWL